MDRTPVQSSTLAAVGYDPRQQLLEVAFHSGAVYQYRGVPQQTFDGLLRAASHGTYFTAHIRDVFPWVRLRDVR